MSAPPHSGKKPQIALLIATGFGLGYVPKAPGTAGSLGGVALFWLCHWIFSTYGFSFDLHLSACRGDSGTIYAGPLTTVAVVALAIAFAGIWAAGRAARYLGRHDPQTVVVDEISGQLIALLGIGAAVAEWKYLLAGFILFRVFDIWKPWPVRQAEQLPGGWGIMADDWMAGIYAALGLWLLRVAGV